MDDDLKALASRIAKFKSKSKNKTYRYPGSIKKDVVKLFNQDSSQSVYVLALKLGISVSGLVKWIKQSENTVNLSQKSSSKSTNNQYCKSEPEDHPRFIHIDPPNKGKSPENKATQDIVEIQFIRLVGGLAQIEPLLKQLTGGNLP